MSKVAIGLVVAVVVVGNVVTSLLVLGLRDSSVGGDRTAGAVIALEASIESLREDVDRLSAAVSFRASSSIVTADSRGAEANDVAARLEAVLERLEALEKSIQAQNEVEEQLAAIGVREKLREQFRADDGAVVAEELIAQKKFAVGANGILTFLEAHPDHPDEQDLMRRARDGFRDSGYLDRALWLQGEIMKKFPEHRGGDLYLIARLERRMKKFDDALRHITESAELATTDQDRLSRLFYRAEIVHQRDGDDAGLAAYREVERLARAAGTGPAEEAGKRADRIQERLAAR